MNTKTAFGLTAGALLAGLLGGIALANSSEPTKAPEVGPTKTVAGVPVGYEQSRSGAAAAALNYEAALIDAGVKDNAKVLDVLADPGRRGEIAAAMKPGLELLQQKLGDQAIIRSSALGYRLSSFEPTVAVVDLWEVGILGSGQSAPQAGWSTTTLRLRWTDGDWKLTDAPQTRSGPTPDGTSDPADFLAFVKGLTGVGHVPLP